MIYKGQVDIMGSFHVAGDLSLVGKLLRPDLICQRKFAEMSNTAQKRLFFKPQSYMKAH